MEEYAFAKGRTIRGVFVDSELFDTSCYGHARLVRVDAPCFLMMDDGSVLRLFGDRLSLADTYDVSCLQSKIETHYELNKAERALLSICERKIVDVRDIYEPICDENDLFQPREQEALDIVLSDGLVLECFAGICGEFSDILIYCLAMKVQRKPCSR